MPKLKPSAGSKAVKKAAPKPAPKKSGRPKAKLNLKKIRERAAEFNSIDEIAASLGVVGRTLLRHKKDAPEVLEAVETGKNLGKCRLRSILWALAKTGNVAAAIFLAKQKTILGYTDKCEVEHGGRDGGPIEHMVNIRFVESEDGRPAEPQTPAAESTATG